MSLEKIAVSGRDLVIELPDGTQMVIENGAVDVPLLIIGDVEIPAVNVAALLIGNEPQPAAGGPQSSGGNFAVAVGDIGPGIGIGNLLPPTGLEFPTPEFEEVYPTVRDEEPTVIIITPDLPAGAPDVIQSTSDAGLPGGSQSESDAEETSGTITFTPGDLPTTVTIDGVVAEVGAIIESEHGFLEITSVSNGNIGYTFTQTENVLHPPGSNDVHEETFVVVVTDADGDTATGTLTITIMDDFPTANADVDSVAEDGALVANGNVMTGTGGADANTTDGVADFQGADDAVQVTGVVAGSAGSASGNVGSSVTGTYGTLTISSSGAYTYTLNNGNAAVQGLDTGETLTDTFTYTITDADSDTSTTTLTVTINGANDAPVANPDTHWVLDVTTGANPTATGNVLQSISHPGAPSGTFADVADTDVDVEALTVTTTGSFTGTYGTLVLNANGSYTYTLDASNAAVNALDTGETLTETFNYTASDGSASASSTLRITIFGTNDGPVANADTNWAQEDVALTATGNVLSTINHPGAPSGTFGDVADTDIDVEALTVTTTGSFTGTYGTLVLNSNGTYTYTLNNGNAAVQALDSGETLSETFNYTASDGTTTASSTLTVTIFGNNDAPVANPDTNWVLDIAAGDNPTTTGNVLQTLAHNGAPSGTFGDVADTDVDVEALTVTTTGPFVGTYGTLVLNADGSYTYTLNANHETVNALDTGETVTDVFNYTASDGTASANATLTITIFGTNDAPVARPDTNWAQEDVAQTATGNVLSTLNHPGAPTGTFGDVADTDIDVETLTVTTTGSFVGTYGTLQLNADGTYTYTVNNAAVQGLDTNETVTDVFNYTASDGSLTASSTLTVTIFGNNDAPVANPDTNWAQEDVAQTATGNLLQTLAHNGAPSGTFGDVADTDVDVETLTVTGLTGSISYGTLIVNANGAYTYTLNNGNAAVQALDDGETLTETITYTVSDGTASATATLTITIFGNNDAPVANADTNWAQEDVAQTATGNVLATLAHNGAPSGTFGDVADTDIDIETLTVTTTGSIPGTYGTLVLNADGSYTYTLNNALAAVQGLDTGETLTDVFNYTASDGTTTASSTLTVTIFGNNDAPVANPDTNWVLDVTTGPNPTTTGNVLQTLAHNGAPSGTFGDVADTDVDVETLTVTTTGSFPGTYGTLVLNADGSYTYTLNASNAAVNALDTGETLTDSFPYTASDGTATANATVTITIFGTNDAPVANADTHWAQEDVSLTATGNVLSTINHPGAPSGTFGDVADTDIDVETLTVTTTGSIPGAYGTLVLNADGSYTYTLNNGLAAVQALDTNETLTDVFNYTASDGTASASSTLTVTIFGNNDAPVANPDTNWVLDTNGEDPTATGNVLQTLAHNGAPSGTFGDVADTDVDVETLTVTTTGVFAGTYGSLQLNADGSYTYTLDSDNATVNGLDNGETLTEVFNYTASDGTASANATLTITIFGTNGAPVANPDTNWAQEDVAQTANGNVLQTLAHNGAPSGLFGDAADTDIDLDTLTVTTTGSIPGTYGTLVLNADGSYTYTLNNALAAVQALDTNETLTDTFNYSVTDGDATASSTLTVTIFGNNDAPVANPDTHWTQEDVSQTATGNVLQTLAHNGAPSGTFGDVADTDIDIEALTVTTTGSIPGTYGTLVLNADGSYTYTLNNALAAVQGLDTGETLTDVFNYTASDGTTTASSTLTVTIFGNNDAPVANPDTNWVLDVVAGPNPTTTGNVLQTLAHNGAPSGTFGDVADTDVDVETLTVTTTGSFPGTYGTLVLNSDGTYTYTLNASNSVVNALDTGETVTDVFNYTASDGTATANATVTITIFGTNDAPVANPDTHWAQEDVSQTATGNVLQTLAHNGAPSGTFGDVADTDIDIETLTVTTTGSIPGTYGTLVLNADGSYTYTLNNALAAVQGLDTGETLTEVFNYTASDGTTTASSTLTVTIFGNNDAPVANPDTNWVLDVTTGPNPTTTGNVLQTLAHNGAPSGTFGDVADTDVDVETLTVTTTGSFPGTYGTLVLNADGSYTYTLNASNAAVNALDTGETLTDSFPYTASDGTATANATVTITIFGTNDAPVANADTHWAQEDVSLTATGNVLSTINHPGAPSGTFGDVADTDIDVETLTVTTTGSIPGTYGTLVLNADGSYTYTLNNGLAAVQALDTGETLQEVFNYTASDGTTTASSTLTVTIFGNNDAPVANPDTNWVLDVVAGPNPTTTGNVLQTLAHNGAPSGTFGDVADTDVDVETLTVTTTGSFPGTYGTLVLNADGSYTYTLNASNAAVNALDTGETLTDVFNYTASDGTATANSTLTITIFGTNDAPVVTPATVTISEEGIPGANADTTGSTDTTNLATNGGTLTVTDVDGEAHTFTLGDPGAVLTSGGATVTWTGVGTGTLIGSANSEEVIRITIDSAGVYSVQIKDGIDHSTLNVEDTDSDLVIPVTVSDGTASTNSTITVTIEDDSPVAFTPGSTPISGALTNVPGSTATYALDADTNINNNVGADDPGTIVFNVTDGQDTAQTSGGDMIELWVSADGQTLEGRTNSTDGSDGDLIYTVTLNQGAGTYTVTLNDTIDNGSGVEFSNLSGGEAGNPPFKTVASSTADTLELLFTPIGTGSVNSDSDDIAAGSQFMDFNVGLRIDFGDFTSHPNGGGNSDNGFTIVDHTTVNGFRFTIDQISNGTVADVKLVTYDANEGSANQTTGAHNFADDTKLAITEVQVFDTAGILVATFTGDGTIAGITADFDGVNGVTLQGVLTQYSIQTFTAGAGYDRIEVTNAGTGGSDGKFSLSELQIEQVDFGDPVPLTIPVQLSDADGDTVDANLNFTVGSAAPPVALDLDGDGVEFVGQSAGMTFDYNGDGSAESTAWVGSDDGVLAIDNGDGSVDVVFSVNGSTDLEGLAQTYDTNGDGQLSAADADFSKFGVLQGGEFRSLADHGIVSLELVSDGVAYTAANGEVSVAGTAAFTYADGSTGVLADAAFAYSAANQEAQRTFTQNSGAYANLLAAAAMISAAAIGFATSDAPTVDLSSAHNFLTEVSTGYTPLAADIGESAPVLIDAFDGGFKDGPVIQDIVRFSQDTGSLLDDSSFDLPQADSPSTLLGGTDLATAHYQAPAPMIVDATVMPVLVSPVATAAETSSVGPDLVTQVLADALSGGAEGMSIDDLLSGIPTLDAQQALFAGAADGFSADALMASATAHPLAFHWEASFLVQHDSVAVTHA